MERIGNMGNAVYVEMVILFPFCFGVRHFNMRGFQEHTKRGGIILKTSVLSLVTVTCLHHLIVNKMIP